MNKPLTLEQILLYSCEEPCEIPDDAVMESLMITDEFLNEELKFFTNPKPISEENMVSPPDELISKIISYSQALAILNLDSPDLRTMMKN